MSANPGELIHIDIKKLGRIGSVGHRITGRQTGVINRHLGIGWEYVHVCIDDASRVAFVRVMANQRKESAVAFLDAAVAYYAKLGIRNGGSFPSEAHANATRELLALRIIDIAQLGERDPARLRDDALLYLKRTNLKSTGL
jgi:hypothetical protein